MALCDRAMLFTITNVLKCVVIDGLHMNFFLNITMGCLKQILYPVVLDGHLIA